MATLNWQLTLMSLIPVVFIVFATRIFSKKIKPYYRRSWRRWTAVFSNLSDTLPCIKVVKSFTGEERSTKIFEQKSKEFIEMDMKIGKIATAFPQIISFLVTCGSLFIWAFGGGKVIEGADGYSPGLIVSFISYASMFYTPVTFFANLSDSYQSTLASVEKILDILEAEPETETENSVVPDKIKGKIEFLHVSFSFDRTKKVLDDATLTIEPGEVVGIVGTTGSGKSTLINLLMRFYSGYSGEILVDGHNIKNFDLGAYRNQIGYVQQDPTMFSDTIYNNISYGNPEATIDDVIHAADVANAHEFIARQPDAYDTMLGERGIGVSGGEKQRISIARAVLKEPSILIFDEATAAVDSETEHLIQDAIDKLIEGKTTLMIAHRLSTLKRANRIIVVDGGKIIENGSPEELMAKKGKYYKLVQIQSMTQDAEKMREEERF
jgi:ATP-binding cassette subfamily B protein